MLGEGGSFPNCISIALGEGPIEKIKPRNHSLGEALDDNFTQLSSDPGNQPRKAPPLSAANSKPWLCWTLNLSTCFSCFQPDFPEKASERKLPAYPDPIPSSENKQAMLATERIAKLTERSDSNKALGGRGGCPKGEAAS